MRGIGLVALAGLALAAGPLRADEITDQLDQARAFYDEGDVGGAIGELEFVLQALRGRLSALLKETFPPAPSGVCAPAWSRLILRVCCKAGARISNAWMERALIAISLGLEEL